MPNRIQILLKLETTLDQKKKTLEIRIVELFDPWLYGFRDVEIDS